MWLFERPIAHRGLHGDGVTENSMEAFRLAVEKGYNIETDVHLLKSGEVVVFHDATLSRVCGKRVSIASLTLDDIKGDKYLLPNGEHIPLFSEVIELVENSGVGILLEIKLQITGFRLEKAIYELIKGKENFIALQSFFSFPIKWFAKNAPEFTRGLLTYGALFPITRLAVNGVRPHFMSHEILSLSNCLKKYCEKRNFNILTWTIDSPLKLQKAIDKGVNNVIFEKLDLEKENFFIDKLPDALLQ